MLGQFLLSVTIWMVNCWASCPCYRWMVGRWSKWVDRYLLIFTDFASPVIVSSIVNSTHTAGNSIWYSYIANDVVGFQMDVDRRWKYAWGEKAEQWEWVTSALGGQATPCTVSTCVSACCRHQTYPSSYHIAQHTLHINDLATALTPRVATSH